MRNKRTYSYKTDDTSIRIKRLREKLGMSQAELAEAFSIPRRTLEAWETDNPKNHNPAPEYVMVLLETVAEYEEIIKHRNERNEEGRS